MLYLILLLEKKLHVSFYWKNCTELLVLEEKVIRCDIKERWNGILENFIKNLDQASSWWNIRKSKKSRYKLKKKASI